MDSLIPSIYDIEFWRNIAFFSMGVSTILAMIIFKLIAEIKSKIEDILKKIDIGLYEEEFSVENRKKSKLYKVRDEKE